MTNEEYIKKLEDHAQKTSNLLERCRQQEEELIISLYQTHQEIVRVKGLLPK